MNEARGNLWKFQAAQVVCITTNGFVKANGRAVMGRGCAKEAAEMFPELPLYLGQKIKRNGNNVAWIDAVALAKLSKECGCPLQMGYTKPPVCALKPGHTGPHRSKTSESWFNDEWEGETQGHIVFFPVKHHWKQQADIELIERSAHQLVELTDRQGWISVYLPRPGCGNGRLSWDYVRPIIEPILDHRFTVVTFV